MVFAKLCLSLGEGVVIHSTGSDDVDDKTGINLGVAYEGGPWPDAYIILLDEPLETHVAVVITEACLSRIQ